MTDDTGPGRADAGSASASEVCNLASERLAAFLDRRLSHDDACAVEAHLARCEACRWVTGRATLLDNHEDSV